MTPQPPGTLRSPAPGPRSEGLWKPTAQTHGDGTKHSGCTGLESTCIFIRMFKMCQDKGVTRKCPPFFDSAPSTAQRQSKKSFHVSDCFKKYSF